MANTQIICNSPSEGAKSDCHSKICHEELILALTAWGKPPHRSKIWSIALDISSHWATLSFLQSSSETANVMLWPWTHVAATCRRGRNNFWKSFDWRDRTRGSLNLAWSIPSIAMHNVLAATLIISKLNLLAGKKNKAQITPTQGKQTKQEIS